MVYNKQGLHLRLNAFSAPGCQLPTADSCKFGESLAALVFKSKSNLHCTRGFTPKCVTSGGAHLRGIAPGQRRFEERSQQWRAAGDAVFDLTGSGIEP